MAHICPTGTMSRLKSWHIYVPLAVDGLRDMEYEDRPMELTKTHKLGRSKN